MVSPIVWLVNVHIVELERERWSMGALGTEDTGEARNLCVSNHHRVPHGRKRVLTISIRRYKAVRPGFE